MFKQAEFKPGLEHGSKPASSGCSTFQKLVQMTSYHSITSMQCSSPCSNVVAIRSHHERGICSNQPEQLKLQKFFILPQQERHSGHSRLSKPSASLFFFWRVHYSSFTMQIHSDSSKICSCLKQTNKKKRKQQKLI